MERGLHAVIFILTAAPLCRGHGDPIAFWLFNDKYDAPYDDVSGNDHDATGHNVELLDEFPMTDYKTAHFSPSSKGSITVAKDNDLAVRSFTAVMYVNPDQRGSKNTGPMWLWEPTTNTAGTSVWQEKGGVVKAQVVSRQNKVINEITLTGLVEGSWARVIASFNHVNGEIAVGINLKSKKKAASGNVRNVNPLTNTGITFGRKFNTNSDKRAFMGSMSCAYLFDEYILPDDLDWQSYHDECFGLKKAVKTPVEGLCRCSGDPHCVSFDGKSDDFQGACTHILAQDNCKNGLPKGDPSWVVAADNWRRGKTKPVSWVKDVYVITQGFTIGLLQEGLVQVDGVDTELPAQLTPGLRVYDMPNYVWVETNVGLTVMWDRTFSVRIIVDESYRDKVCGMCGNFDGNPDNDFTVGPNDDECTEQLTDKDAEPGQQTDDVNHFGYSWLFGLDDEDCDCETPKPPGPCTPSEEVAAKQRCAVLSNDVGPMKDCLATLTEGEVLEITHECVYDLCHVSLNVEATVCAYASQEALTCAQKHNLNIKWRDPRFCAPVCPPNSKYTECMPDCLPTCDDPKGENCLQTGLPCVEGCVCKEGLMFIDGQCQQRTKCGCVNPNGGGIIGIRETLLNEDCTEECRCPRPADDPVCKPHSCSDVQHCGVEDGKRKCVCNVGFTEVDGECQPDAVCKCIGDPHCYSFDGHRVDFMGGCTYVLAQDNCGNGIPRDEPTWVVAADNWDQDSGRPVTWVKDVIVAIGEDRIELQQGGAVTVNGIEIGLPYQLSDGVLIHDMPNFVWVSTDFGLTVMWDRESVVRVQVKPDKKENVCGICGDYNGNKGNDMTVGPNTDECTNYMTDKGASVGKQTSDVNHFGYSWLYELDDDEECDCEGKPKPSICDKKRKKKAKKACAQLKNKKGPLKACLKRLPAKIAAEFYNDCVFDLCEVDLEPTEVLCEYASLMILRCQAEFGKKYNWRSSKFCPIDCQENAHYEQCVSCQPSCADPEAEQCDQGVTCMEGCSCDQGFVFQGGKCIAKRDCGCVDPVTGALVEVGETILTGNCTRRCQCKKFGEPAECEDHDCGSHATCIVENGKEKCNCMDEHVLIDGACRGPAVCSAYGDPHLTQFDGGHVTFHGACKYTIARDNCENGLPKKTPNFEVVVNNQRITPDRKVAEVDEVIVFFPGYDLEILLQEGGGVKVNNKVTKVPNSPNDDVRIYDMPNYLHVTSEKLGLKVQWDRDLSVRVTIAPEYYEKTCGICGIYNGVDEGDSVVGPSSTCTDKFKATPGELTDNQVLLGTSWFHSFDENEKYCKEDCDDPTGPAACSAQEERAAERACEEIGKQLKKCFDALKPKRRARFMAECVLDVCNTGETEKYVCEHAQNMATFCSENLDIHIDYVSQDFCPPDCPAGSSFDKCGPVCQPTCADPQGKDCLDLGACQPGCFCSDGLLFDGKKCVTEDKCSGPEIDTDNPCQDTELQCFTCKNVDSDEECFRTGKFQTCSLPDAICEYTKNVQKTGAIVKVNRKCASRPKCTKGSVGNTVCKQANGNIDACTICYYGDVIPNKPDEPVFKCKAEVSRESCNLPKDPGTASSNPETRYFFNRDKCECQTFPYRGVGGNANNFKTKQGCADLCYTWEQPDECLAAKDPGPCTNFKNMYYYDKEDNLCKTFRYGGCEGSPNRFRSKQTCRNTCKSC